EADAVRDDARGLGDELAEAALRFVVPAEAGEGERAAVADRLRALVGLGLHRAQGCARVVRGEHLDAGFREPVAQAVLGPSLRQTAGTVARLGDTGGGDRVRLQHLRDLLPRKTVAP